MTDQQQQFEVRRGDRIGVSGYERIVRNIETNEIVGSFIDGDERDRVRAAQRLCDELNGLDR